MSAGPAEENDRHEIDTVNLSAPGIVRENQATDTEQDAPTITVDGPGKDDRLDLNDLNNVFIVSAPTSKRLAQILEALLSREQSGTPRFQFFDDKGATVYEPEPFSSGDALEWRPIWEIFDSNPKGLPKPTEVRERFRDIWPSSFGHLTMAPDGITPGFSWTQGVPGYVRTAFYARNREGGLANAGLQISKRLPDLARLTRLERPCIGRVWILPTLMESIRDQSSSTLSLEHVALVMNYCQTVNGNIDRNFAEDHQFSPALGFLEGHMYPWYPAGSTTFQLGTIGPRSSRGNAVDLVMHWHIRSLARHLQFAFGDKHPPTGPRVFIDRQRAMLRGSSRGYDGSSNPVALREIVYSTSLCILNTDEAPYTILLLADEPKTLVRPGTLAPVLAPITEGIVLDGRCAGLAHFMLFMSQVFRQWEANWLETLNAIDSVSEFHLSSTLNDADLDALMFDDSFSLSRAYFAALQTLRSISNMVDDCLQDLASLRQEWDRLAPVSGMFSSHDLSIAAKNWDTLTMTLETRVQRVQARVARKTEDIKSLRDGLFNATSLREASKGIALNRAIYVFTVVTVLYTPVGFLATFWAMPIFNNTGTSDGGGQPALPRGFTTTFIAVPLLTYIICIAVAWTMGLNDNERRTTVERTKKFLHRVYIYCSNLGKVRGGGESRRLGTRLFARRRDSSSESSA